MDVIYVCARIQATVSQGETEGPFILPCGQGVGNIPKAYVSLHAEYLCSYVYNTDMYIIHIYHQVHTYIRTYICTYV